MTQPDVNVSPEAMIAHSRAVEETAAMLAEAQAGAAYVGMHDEVYGKLCGHLIVARLDPLQEDAIKGLAMAVEATQGLAEKVRAMARNLIETDQSSASKIEGIR
jgi:hypothetical protein